jgi:DNA-binding transcriptional regulator of glucitol operon
MPAPYFFLLLAVVLGWILQLVLTYKQSMAFNADVRRMRTSGTVSVGVDGKRYRGGRAFVAIAVDDRGIVRDAISLRGFTTFARGRTVPALIGVKVNRVRGDGDIPGLSRQKRGAARQAATLMRPAADRAIQEVLG